MTGDPECPPMKYIDTFPASKEAQRHQELITHIDHAREGHNVLAEVVQNLTLEVNLLSGRVELTMRLLSRIIAKMDPGFLDDPGDPKVQRRSRLLGDSVIKKIKQEALAQASSDPEAFDRLQRYFKDVK